MDKEIFQSLKQGLKEADSFNKGKLKLKGYKAEIEIPDVKEIRKNRFDSERICPNLWLV